MDMHLERHPDDPLALAFCALTHLALDDATGAADLAGRALGLAPDDAICLSTLGQIYWKTGDLPRAEQFFRLALNREPAMVKAVEGMTAVLKATKRFDDVGPVLETAAAAAPQKAMFPQALSHHYRVVGKADEALAAARRAVAIGEGEARSWRELGVCLISTAKEDSVEALTRAVALGDDSAEIWNILGVALGYLERLDEARDAFRRAIERAPDGAQPWTNLGNLETRFKKGERCLEDGIAAYREALVRDPNSYEVHNNLALALRELGQKEDALAHARRALELRPDDEVVMGTLANLLRHLGELTEARAVMEMALERSPDSPEHHANMGLILLVEGDLEGAERYLRIAAEAADSTPEICLNLVQFLMGQHRYGEAGELLKGILAEDPDHVRTRMSQALLYFNQYEYEEAERIYRDLLKVLPKDWNVRYSLGVTLWNRGKMIEALDIAKELVKERPNDSGVLNLIGCCANDVLEVPYANGQFRRAVDESPPGTGASFLSNLCFNSHYGDGPSKEELFAMHREWDQRFGSAVTTPGPTHENDRNPDRRLRIGYVSPDFRRHSVAYFIVPVIANHDRNQFEVTCYSLVTAPDMMTDLIKENCDRWREAAAWTHDQFAEEVKRDEIDILIDLSGHTGDSGLPVFVRKPAPVQVTYLGYPNTTGLSAIDWRLTDIHADPQGQDEDPMSERPYRLPRSFLLYRPVDDLPDVTPPPFLENGYVTFGSFNNLSKLSRTCLRTWMEILDAVPDSRLLLKAKVLRDPPTRERIALTLADWGLDMKRVDLVSYAPTLRTHMQTYGKVDIALDTFPYNGTTTTYEALQMGVPVVGCRGTRHSGRVGASILTNLGLAADLLGEGAEDMREKAVALAHDLPRLTTLRATLRDILRASPGRQTMAFMADLEVAYRDMWRQWVAGPLTHGWIVTDPRPSRIEAEDAITPEL